MVVALSAHVPNPGDYRAGELAGVPTLTVRQDDGSARVFLNVCRHRGAQLVAPGCGAARRFTCPYHAWSYRADGALAGITGRATFGELDTEAHGLTELPSAERAGLVFAVLDPAADLDLDGWLAGYDAVLEPLGLDAVEVVEERELVGPNWKVAFDGYVDGYHLDILHKDTLGRDVMGNLITCDAWGPHQRVAFARRNIVELRDAPRDEWEPARHLSLVHTVFPHLSIAGNGPDALMVSQLSPGPTPDRSRTIQTHVVRRGRRTTTAPRHAGGPTTSSASSSTRTTGPGSASRPAWRRAPTPSSCSAATSRATSASTSGWPSCSRPESAIWARISTGAVDDGAQIGCGATSAGRRP